MLKKDIEKNLPFISVVQYGGEEYIGVISNQDAVVTSMYVLTKCREQSEQDRLLELGEVWWWESNRLIPINIFLRKEMDDLRHVLITMASKDVKVTMGPTVNLNNLSIKRVKRNNI